MNKSVSPSRSYVAMINRNNFQGYRFVKFKLPILFENDSEQASLYYLKRLDMESCIDGCLTVEDYLSIKVEKSQLSKPAMLFLEFWEKVRE